jgi:hypothetical protein
MERNMSTFDRIPRFVLAVVLAFFIFNGTLTGVTMIAAGVFAIAFKITSAMGYCPLYQWFGINTFKKK